jgi:hypothetical protein
MAGARGMMRRFDTNRKVVGFISDGVIGFPSTDLILPVELWLWDWLSIWKKVPGIFLWTATRPARMTDVTTICLENIGFSTSHKLLGLHGLLQGQLYLLAYLPIYFTLNWTPWPESASELYRSSDRRLSAKLVPTFADTYFTLLSIGPMLYCIDYSTNRIGFFF